MDMAFFLGRLDIGEEALLFSAAQVAKVTPETLALELALDFFMFTSVISAKSSAKTTVRSSTDMVLIRSKFGKEIHGQILTTHNSNE